MENRRQEIVRVWRLALSMTSEKLPLRDNTHGPTETLIESSASHAARAATPLLAVHIYFLSRTADHRHP